MMEFRKAEKNDMVRIMELIRQAKAFLKANGVDQWQDGYPEQRDIEGDIRDGIGYVLTDDDVIIAYTGIDFRGEPAYKSLRGQWLNEEPYAVIHRTAVDNAVKGKGLAQHLFAQAERIARERGVYNIRIDTDEDNKIMRHVIEKRGFVYCGVVIFADSPKIAFQKCVHPSQDL